MRCYYCGASLDYTDVCPDCDADVHIWKKVNRISNHLYNEGLSRAQVRDLSGAIASLQMGLRYNKQNIEARNLLGLIYYEMGETVNALSEWVISKSMMPEDNPASSFFGECPEEQIRIGENKSDDQEV
ncbi:MAG: tetratricopeptide repeat protein [Lachnospiraceae bacterium]|nr:tetratricopeptide repeat protein [Lachnospiraceae bacterium]